MSPSVSVRWSLSLVLLSASVAHGQLQSAAGIGAVMQRQSAGGWQSSTRIEPALRVDNPWLQLNGDAAFIADSRGSRLERGGLQTIAESPAWRGLRASSALGYERLGVSSGYSPDRSAGSIALSYARGSRGAWLGLESERSFGARGFDGAAMIRPGAWQQLGSALLTVSSGEHRTREATTALVRVFGRPIVPDTLTSSFTTPDTGRMELQTVSRVRRWSELEARLTWTVGRAVLDGRLSMQPAADSARSLLWGSATATVGLAHRLSLVGSFGTRPERSWLGMQGARFATLGVRLSPSTLARPAAPPHVQPAAARFTLRRAEGGGFVIALRVPSARSVEISGDFNQWVPIALREVSPDVWETTVALAPGSYHVNVRVNGASWTAPPGLASTTDDFNGTVGLLVVPPGA